MCTPQTISDDTLSYGEKLYRHKHFGKWFTTFSKDQKRSAKLIWDRVLEKCGKDQDLPPITHIVDYGCGEGTFLNYLFSCYQEAKKADRAPELVFKGIDCCQVAIDYAKSNHDEIAACLAKCDPCPDKALAGLFDDRSVWKSTALLVMGHSWFHFDQDCLIRTILELRPAIILVDVYQSWNDVVRRLADGASMEMEHGRRFKDGSTYWLRTEQRGNGKVSRGIYRAPADKQQKADWEFVTCQTPKTTEDLFGGLSSLKRKRQTPEQILTSARTSGDFVETTRESEKSCAYIHDRQYLHNTGWGPMECHVLVSLSPEARIMNRAWFTTVSNLIRNVVLDHSMDHTSGLARMMGLFNDPKATTTKAAKAFAGSREALVLLPFEPNATFARIIPIHQGQDSTISQFPLLVEHPTRWQTQFPSANGVFQTCLGHSSSAQAFPTGWAHDYDLTLADKALERLELKVLGLNDEGVWGNETQPAAYFMVPFYRGSLPMFCLALKFPQHFAPETTAFGVYESTIKSLHDAIQTSLTDEVMRFQVIRPWIEQCLMSCWPVSATSSSSVSLKDKIDKMETLLFGKESDEMNESAYRLGKQWRVSGVLSKRWKSWILGLPSFPINKMEAVKEENRRLWEIWEKEKRIACHHAALRISLWFQDGQFFEDGQDGEKSHDDFICDLHLGRLRTMFQSIGFRIDTHLVNDDSWLEQAVQYLRAGVSHEGSVRQYFGSATTKHFLFKWLCDRLHEIHTLKSTCSIRPPCPDAENPNCPRHKGPFMALKSVFCKSRANKGEQVRFSLHRLFHVLDAACFVGDTRCGIIAPLTIEQLDRIFYLPKPFEAKFWSLKDPTIILGEFVNCLAKMEILKTVSLVSAVVNCGSACLVAEIHLNMVLNKQMGGNEADRLRVYADELVECGATKFDFEDPTTTIKIQCSISQDGN